MLRQAINVAILAVVLLIPVYALSAPSFVADLQAQIDALDARVAALEGTTTTLPTTTVPPPTTSTLPPTTSTTTSSSTTTTGPTRTPSGPIYVNTDGTVIDSYDFVGSGITRCVTVEGAANVTITNSTFTNCYQGVYALDSSNIVVTDSTFYADLADRGRNAVQFDKVAGGYIARNQINAPDGATLAEDHISVYASHGTAGSPLIVEDNVFAGGGPSGSGSCIMAGDAGGSWIVVRDNYCDHPGQVGIGVPGGTNITVDGNTVVSPQLPWSNVGIYVWNQSPSPCSDITITDNTADWFNSSGIYNPFWNAGNCGTVVVSGNDW